MAFAAARLLAFTAALAVAFGVGQRMPWTPEARRQWLPSADVQTTGSSLSEELGPGREYDSARPSDAPVDRLEARLVDGARAAEAAWALGIGNQPLA